MQSDLFEEKKSQTEIKHNILESYIRPWAIIIRNHFPRAFYVDAFAGAGKYKSGEDGSPVIAARILLEEQKANCQFNVICIEKDKGHVDKLRNCQKEFLDKIPFGIQHGEFTEKIDKILKSIGNSPAFFLVDPAGFAGMDFAKVQSILKLPHKELLINFMCNALQRWKSIPSLRKTITALFGTDKWESIDNEWELLNLYMQQIRNTKSFVWPFKNKFPDKDRTFYYLIYATKNLVGFKIMKQIMFRADTRKYFEPSLFEEVEFDNYVKALQALVVKYKQVQHSTLLAYTLQETQYLEKDLKRAIEQLVKELKIESENDSKDPVYRAGCRANNPFNFETINTFDLKTLPIEHQTLPRIIDRLRVVYSEYKMLDGSSKQLVKQVGDGSIIVRFDKTLFPREPNDVVCPHFLELKWAYGCPYDCSWCYLKGTFRFSPTKARPQFKDFKKVEQHVTTFIETVTQSEILNTGELSDSLMYETEKHSFVEFIAPMFEAQDQHKVLFVTKSNKIENLLQLESHKQIVVSFSLNAEKVAMQWEKRAPKVSERIEAAKMLSEKGLNVRIRIDPLVPVEGWKEEYLKLIDRIFTAFRPEQITLGSLRGLQSTINGCSDKSWMQYLSEPSNWGKKVKFELRYEVYQQIINYLMEKYGFSKVALCKETKSMWNTLGLKYKDIRCNCMY